MTRAASGAAVTLRGVSVAYPESGGRVVTAVHDADLSVAAGSIVALLGPSGCGKTSLLRAVAGLEEPAEGRIDIGGRTVSDQPGPGVGARRVWIQPEQRDVGMVFQDGALFPHLTVTQNIVFGLRAKRKGLSRAELSDRVDELLRLVDLTGYGDRLPETLSGGQQQRVALARSLAPQPKVLLLDEPFSALDTALRTQVRAEVAHILREVGVTTVFVTHDQDEAFVLGDQVAVMHDGSIEQFGSPDELYRSPQTPWVAGFVGEANFLAGTISDQIAPGASNTIDADTSGADSSKTDTSAAATALTPIGIVAIDDRRSDTSTDAVRVLIRPEQIALVPFIDDGADSEVEVAPGEPAVVTAVEYYGHDVRYELALADGSTIAARTHSTELYERGARVTPMFQSRERDSRSAAFSVDDVRGRDAAQPSEASSFAPDP